MKYYLAVDIGASSGRMILAHLENKKIVMEEVHRFRNGMITKNGHLIWDGDLLFHEILTGMKKCKELEKIPSSIGVDTWGVDYALLDEEGKLLGDIYGYRDSRTIKMLEKVYSIISEEELYKRTGIQRQLFNTIFQLMAHKEYDAELFERADTMLMMPDYFHYLLSGKKVSEYTEASTSQLLDPHTRNWDYDLIDLLGLPRKIFAPITLPGTDIGELTEEIQKEVGYNCHVVLPPTHDTASAVMAVPVQSDDSEKEDILYISSGTWSLIGTELQEPNCSMICKEKNFTNEGGYNYHIRFLKNSMGMWMINTSREELAPDMSFDEIAKRASQEEISSIVNVMDDRYMAPTSMVEEIQKECEETGQQIPQGIGEVAAVVYHSLAKCYADTLRDVEEITGKHFPQVNVVGGGLKASYLNELTAKACNRPVVAGPVEATALGNLSCQMIASGEIKDLSEAKKCIYNSVPMTIYNN